LKASDEAPQKYASATAFRTALEDCLKNWLSWKISTCNGFVGRRLSTGCFADCLQIQTSRGY